MATGAASPPIGISTGASIAKSKVRTKLWNRNQTAGQRFYKWRRSERDRLSGNCLGGLLALLRFVGSAFEQRDTTEREGDTDCGDRKRASGRHVCHKDRGSAGDYAERVHSEHGATLAPTEICETVSGVIFARCREWDEATARTGNRDERRVEDCGAQNQNWDKPA